MTIIIGITGRAGSGKDTAADILINEYGFIKYSMAKPLKDMLQVIGASCNTQEEKAAVNPIFGVTNRQLAQTLGTEWMRDNVCVDGWVRLARHNINRLIAEGCVRIVIPDIRFDNEATLVHDLGMGRVVHISREVNPVGGVMHNSELGITDELIDFKIKNNTSVEDLHQKINEIFLYVHDNYSH